MQSSHESIHLRRSSIAEELWIEILKRLPVKTLFQSRCVCKSWNSFPSSPFFIDLHRTSTAASAALQTHLRLNVPCVCINTDSPYHDSYTLSPPRPLNFPFRIWEEHADSQTNFPINSTCVDVVHGVICVSYSRSSSFDSTILWNPAIHKYLALPRLQSLSAPKKYDRQDRFLCHGIGFGYDNSTKNLKVARVWIPPIHNKPSAAVTEVYSVGEGNWSSPTPNSGINLHNCDFFVKRTGCYVNGTIYWLLTNLYSKLSRKYCILMFDCERDVLTTMQLPEQVYRYSSGLVWEVELSVCDGKVAALVKVTESREIDVWVMAENGEGNSWGRLVRILCDPKAGIGFEDVHVYPPLLKLSPSYGPHLWIEFCWLFGGLRCKVSRVFVYDESLLLMDVRMAQSYPKDGVVHLF